MNQLFGKRFTELDSLHGNFTYHDGGMGLSYCPSGEWEGWATSVENLIKAVYGERSPHYANFCKAYEGSRGNESDIRKLVSLFRSAKTDFEGGYVFNVDLRVSGEIFGDFVVLAKQCLSEGQKDVAAVLACAALEDALKRLALAHGLSVEGKAMSDVVNALKTSGLIQGAQKALLDAMPKIRNMAMHAEWTRITEPDVSSVLGYVEQLLLTRFGEV
jgi:hypothetical protein